jgi:hypothetical protein
MYPMILSNNIGPKSGGFQPIGQNRCDCPRLPAIPIGSGEEIDCACQ